MPSSPSQPPLTTSFFLDHLQRESARFREVLAQAPAAARVPTCPDWNADDLLWHLGDVQWFWGEIAERGLTTGEQVQGLGASRPERPAGHTELLDHFDRSSARLHTVLARLTPETELWMWADDHSAAYIARRQAHEALIHRLDAELTVGCRTPLDPALATDGADEALNIMRGYVPEPGLSHSVLGGTVLLTVADDSAVHLRTLVPVRVTGSSGGRTVDVTRLLVETADPPPASDGRPVGGYVSCEASILGKAEDVDAWLWNRPPIGQLRRRGDETALAAVEAVVGGSID